MSDVIETDVLIVGAGPIGLFAVFDVYVNDKAGKLFTEFEQ